MVPSQSSLATGRSAGCRRLRRQPARFLYTTGERLQRTRERDLRLAFRHVAFLGRLAQRLWHHYFAQHSGHAAPSIRGRDRGDEPLLVPSFTDEAEVELDRRFPLTTREQSAKVASVVRAQQVASPLPHVVGDPMHELVARLRNGGEADTVGGVDDGDVQGLLRVCWQ